MWLALILVGIALGYPVFVLFCDGPRRQRQAAQRANMMSGPSLADLALAVHPATLGWTALDDQQLTRLLKGSAP